MEEVRELIERNFGKHVAEKFVGKQSQLVYSYYHNLRVDIIVVFIDIVEAT